MGKQPVRPAPRKLRISRPDAPLQELVFMTPSWSSIYIVDEDRTMTLEAVRVFGDQCHAVYSDLGYRVMGVPSGSPRERAEFVLNAVLEQH
jgi:predicted ATPase